MSSLVKANCVLPTHRKQCHRREMPFAFHTSVVIQWRSYSMYFGTEYFVFFVHDNKLSKKESLFLYRNGDEGAYTVLHNSWVLVNWRPKHPVQVWQRCGSILMFCAFWENKMIEMEARQISAKGSWRQRHPRPALRDAEQALRRQLSQPVVATSACAKCP